MSAPPKLCEVFQIAHHNPRSLREYQVFRIFEHGGHPQPWKKALIDHKIKIKSVFIENYEQDHKLFIYPKE